MRRDLGAGLDQPLHRLHRLLEHRPLRRIEVDLDDLLDAVGADHHRHADVHALHAVLAVEVGGAGQHAALVLEVALGHLDRGGGRRIEGGAGLQEVDDLAAAAARALDDGVELLLRDPAHLDEVGQRDAGNRGVAGDRHHVVAVAAEHQRRHVLDRDLQLLGQEGAEAAGVEDAGHADDLVLRQSAGLLQRPHHGIERVGDDDDEGVGRVLLDAGARLVHHLEVDAEQVVAAHAGLPRHAGRDDDHVGAFDLGVGVGRLDLAVEAFDRAGLRDVEALAARHALDDVEQDDVAELLEADEMGKRAADHASADQRDLLTRHD